MARLIDRGSIYRDVIKQFKRMCWYYSHDKMQISCPMCMSYPNCNIGQCRKIAFEKPEHFVATVMRWAAEHPEPVYPTLAEWLRSIGLANHRMIDPIPADIAEKLGIQPKEDV